MKTHNLIAILLYTVILSACANAQQKKETVSTTQKNDTAMNQEMNKPDEEWKKILTPEQYRVLREKGTERPYTGKYEKNTEKGVYTCAACGSELFSSDDKFDAGCGWPSFTQGIKDGKIKTSKDISFGMARTEITCAKCGGHLGHVFDDGPQPTGLRYCVNSISLDFKKIEKK